MGSTQSSSSVNLDRHVEERDTVEAKAETEDRKVDITPLCIENAHGNVTLPLESPPEGGDLNRQTAPGVKRPLQLVVGLLWSPDPLMLIFLF